jgi:hypothetical protein
MPPKFPGFEKPGSQLLYVASSVDSLPFCFIEFLILMLHAFLSVKTIKKATYQDGM